MSATTARECDDCGGSGVRTIEGKRFACPRCLESAAYEVAPPGMIAGLEAEVARLTDALLDKSRECRELMRAATIHEAEAVRLRGERDAIVGWAVRGAHHVGQFPASGPARRWWAHGADATYYGATAADAILTAAVGGGEGER